MIGIIITTFLRDELLFKAVQSILDNWIENFEIIIVDQGEVTTKKHEWINKQSKIHYIPVLFNSGLSYCRNVGVQKAKELGCEYCFIGSDSFLFNESLKKIDNIVDILEKTNYDLIGVELIPSVCGWEAKLNIIKGKHFELDFIDKDKKLAKSYITKAEPSTEYQNEDGSPVLVGDIIYLWDVDICRNIFIAKTESLLNTKWDNNLKLGGHEDFFWRYKQNGYKCAWTNALYANKMTDRPNEYKQLRRTNFNEGLIYLRKKYNITNWVEYKNLERAKEYQKYSNLDK